jgi:hypothetical protein
LDWHKSWSVKWNIDQVSISQRGLLLNALCKLVQIYEAIWAGLDAISITQQPISATLALCDSTLGWSLGINSLLHVSLTDQRSFVACHFDRTSTPNDDRLHNGYLWCLDIVRVRAGWLLLPLFGLPQISDDIDPATSLQVVSIYGFQDQSDIDGGLRRGEYVLPKAIF